MKKLLFLLSVIGILISTSGCYDSNEISRLAFIIAVGIDNANDGLYEYTFQAVNPSAFDSGESDAEPLSSTTISASTIYAAMDKLNSEISEKCDYSHIKLVVISQDLFKAGANDVFNSMLKSDSFHPNTRVAMSYTKASEYLKNMKIPLDTNPAEYYENVFNQKYSVYSPDTRLRDMEKGFSNHAVCNVLPVVKAKDEKEDKKTTLDSFNTEQIAIIKDYKLTDIAKQNEAFLYNLITGKNFRNNLYIKYPGTDKDVVVELIKKAGNIDVDLSDGRAVINVNINLDGSVLWSEYGGDYISDDEKFRMAVKEKTENELSEFLYRCSQKYKADICDFAKRAKVNYRTIQYWENEDWQGLFEQADYKVNIDVNIKREGINLK